MCADSESCLTFRPGKLFRQRKTIVLIPSVRSSRLAFEMPCSSGRKSPRSISRRRSPSERRFMPLEAINLMIGVAFIAVLAMVSNVLVRQL